MISNSEWPIGVWVDCVHGIYIGKRIMLIAKEHGFVVEDADMNPNNEGYWEAWDCAMQFMDDLAPQGTRFVVFEDGSWGLGEETDDYE